jgi:hypothetical protein
VLSWYPALCLPVQSLRVNNLPAPFVLGLLQDVGVNGDLCACHSSESPFLWQFHSCSLADYSIKPTFNPDQPNGGNPEIINVNAQWAGVEFNYVYMIIESFLVFLIIPGIGLFYGGLSRRKSALAMLFQSILVIAVCTFQWMFWGYSLAFSRTAGPFIGDLANFGLKNVLAAPSIGGPIPEIVFCL